MTGTKAEKAEPKLISIANDKSLKIKSKRLADGKILITATITFSNGKQLILTSRGNERSVAWKLLAPSVREYFPVIPEDVF